jgi:hypothetical protein
LSAQMGPAASIRRGGRSLGAVQAVRRLSDASWPIGRLPSITIHIQGAVEQAEVAHAPADQVHVAGSVATMFYAARPLV